MDSLELSPKRNLLTEIEISLLFAHSEVGVVRAPQRGKEL